jgi:hypothetical protein
VFGLDPLAVLAQPPSDAVVTMAALGVAQRYRRDYDEAFIKALSKGVGGEVGRVVAKMLKRVAA